MKKILISVAVLIGVIQSTNAQTSVGIKAGFNISNYSYKAEETDVLNGAKFNSQLGGQLGFVVNSQIIENFAIRPELILSSKGSKIEFGDKSTMQLVSGYLEIPVNLVYGIPLNDKFKVDIFTGPYVGLGLGGYFRTEDSNGDLINDGTIKFKKEPDVTNQDEFYLNGFDAGFNFGLGLHLGGLIVSYNYQLGLSNVDSKPQNEWANYDRSKMDAISNRISTIGITYLFGQ